MQSQKIYSTILILSIIFIATYFMLPVITEVYPDPYFHIKITPPIYWIGYVINLAIIIIFVIVYFMNNINKKYKYLIYTSMAFLTIYIYIYPRLMYINRIYTDTYQFLGEVYYVLQNGHFGFGFVESPALSFFSATFCLITGLNYNVFAEYFQLIIPIIFLFLVYMITRFMKINNFLMVYLTYISLNWLMPLFNRETFSLSLYAFVVYCLIKYIFINEKRISLKYLIMLCTSYIALVISHPAISFIIILHSVFSLIIIGIYYLIQQNKFYINNYDINEKIFFKIIFISVFFFITWTYWQINISGSIYQAIQNFFVALSEFIQTPNPSIQINAVVSKYSKEYFLVVILRLSGIVFISITGAIISIYLLFNNPNLKNIILISWFISTMSLNIIVLYLKSWLHRPYLYSILSYSLLLPIFIKSTINVNNKLLKYMLKKMKPIFLIIIILMTAALPLTMYSPAPFMFPDTTFLDEFNFVTKYGEGTLVIFDHTTVLRYYILINNASIFIIQDSDLFDSNSTLLINKINDYKIMGTNFRNYIKEVYVISEPSLLQSSIDLEKYVLNNTKFSKVYDSYFWSKLYSRAR